MHNIFVQLLYDLPYSLNSKRKPACSFKKRKEKENLHVLNFSELYEYFVHEDLFCFFKKWFVNNSQLLASFDFKCKKLVVLNILSYIF